MFFRTLACWGLLLSGACAHHAELKSNAPREVSADSNRITVVGQVALKDYMACRLTLAEQWRSVTWLQFPGETAPATPEKITVVNAEAPGQSSIFIVNPEGFWILQPQPETFVYDS
ncbi:MAG: hypothetical protein M3Y07_11280 [Acidobacteriota bacterium]|nr:hypothetical protein [Acidobacteriota bacterium]